ncbi:DUF5988 family protein [Nocardia arthritidis]|uniref:Uncharacterized protein n=1 Tax=Nocardia arthritidis TaxID=228602 RepID=A0A6G9YKE2_9NOCA|nr:DUF5988 family protein [Nocardia arthritidis]QIS13537.1 hypothetical protein F5544_28430 [Nocardia arthritidis]
MSNAARAVLEGGPADLPTRVVTVTPPGTEIKVQYKGGYEHFEATPRLQDTAEGPLRVYAWTYRTAIAE